MKITFLGTGTSQGIPVVSSSHPVCLSDDKRDKRLRVSIMLEWDDYRYIVDCGPDFRYQMLREEVTAIDGLLITHEHADHVAGLDDLRPFVFQMGAVPIYADKRVLDILAYRFEYIFRNHNKYPGAPSVQQIEIGDKPFKLKNIVVTPIEVLHGKLKIKGFRFEKVAYLTDVKHLSDAEIAKLQNLEVLVISAIRHKPHPTHLNLEEALILIDKINPKRTFITHISHHMGFHAEVEKTLPKGVYLAYDGLSVSIN